MEALVGFTVLKGNIRVVEEGFHESVHDRGELQYDWALMRNLGGD